MAGSVIKARYRFTAGTNGYLNDRLVPATGITMVKNFVVPPDIDSIIVGQMIEAVGGEYISIADIDIVPGTRNIACSDSNNFKPRRLKFIRANGNSFSLVLADRTNAIAAATAVAALMPATNLVVCVQLIGEEYTNLYDELVPAGTPLAIPGVPSRPPAATAKGLKYSGLLTEYASDVPFGTTVLSKFSMATDTFDVATGKGDVPSIFGAALLTGCMGAVQISQLCPPTAARTPRHFIVTSLVVSNNPDNVLGSAQETKIPVADNVGIQACGVALAEAASTLCLGYKGESYSRLHNLFAPAPAPA